MELSAWVRQQTARSAVVGHDLSDSFRLSESNDQAQPRTERQGKQPEYIRVTSKRAGGGRLEHTVRRYS